MWGHVNVDASGVGWAGRETAGVAWAKSMCLITIGGVSGSDWR